MLLHYVANQVQPDFRVAAHCLAFLHHSTCLRSPLLDILEKILSFACAQKLASSLRSSRVSNFPAGHFSGILRATQSLKTCSLVLLFFFGSAFCKVVRQSTVFFFTESNSSMSVKRSTHFRALMPNGTLAAI